MSKLTASPDISAFLASSTKTQARANIGFDSSPVVVSNETARKTSGSYVGGPQVGATRVIQADTPNIVWHLIAADITNDNSWIGQPYTSDSSGIIDVDLEISDVSAVVPNVGVIGRVGKNLTLGDGKTVGGYRIDTGVRGNQLGITLVVNSNDTLSGYDVTSINVGDYVNTIKGVHVGNKVTSIGSYAFYNDTFDGTKFEALTKVTISDSVTSIGSYSFMYCSALENINFPNSIVNISTGSFIGATSLTNVTLPDSLTDLGNLAFGYCTSLINLTLSDNLTAIPESAFEGCTSLNDVTLPADLVNIGSRAFYGCTSLNDVTLPADLVNIGSRAFYDCTALDSIIIPNNVENIYLRAFKGCTALETLIIGNNVSLIDSGAFSECTSLSTINCYADPAPTVPGNTLTLPGEPPITSTSYDQFSNVLTTEIHVLIGATGYGETFAGLTVVYDL